MGDEVRCKLNFRILKQDGTPGAIFDGAVLTVVPKKTGFKIVYNQNAPMDFRPDEFREFPDRPKLVTATLLTIDFLDNDATNRKQLFLKFGASSELATIYDALLPMFEQAGKLAKKRAKKISTRKENDSVNLYAKSPNGQPPKRSRNCGSTYEAVDGEVRCTLHFRIIKHNSMPGTISDRVVLIVVPNKPSFTLVYNENLSMDFRPEEFREFPNRPPPATGTVFTIDFLENDEKNRKQLYLKFGASSDLAAIYKALLPMFDQAGKLTKKSNHAISLGVRSTQINSTFNFASMPGQSNEITQPEFKDRVVTSPWRFRSFDNLGNSSYMNSVLQVFFYSSGTQSRLRRLKGHEECRANSCNLLINLFEFEQKMGHLRKLEDSNDKPRDYIRMVLEKIRKNSGVKLNPDFSSYRQQDAHEYWTKLVGHLDSNIKTYEKLMEACKEISNHPTSQKPLIEDKKPIQRFQNPADFNSLSAPGDLFKIQTVSSCLALKEARTEESLDIKLDISDNVFCKDSVDYLVTKCLEIEVFEFACDKCGSKDANKTQAVQTFPPYLMLVVMRHDYNDSSGRKNNSILINRDLFLDHIHADSDEKQDEREVLHKERAEKANLKQYVSMKFTRHANSSLQSADFKPKFSHGNYGWTQACNIETESMEVDDVPRNNDVYMHTEIAANIYFKPLTSKVLFNIRNELTIAHLVQSEESIWYESVFLPECELSCGEVPEKFSVDGDGNCLFRSLSWWLFHGIDEHHDKVRMLITEFLTMFPAEFTKLLNEGENMYDHISNMRNDYVWGSHVELSAAATMFRCPIFTYYNNAWKKFPPLFATYFDEQERRYEKLSGPVEYDVVIKGAIYLSNEEGFHYDPVVGRKIRPEMHSLEHPDPVYVYRESDGHVYTLTGVINHIGTSMTCGHYKAMTFDDIQGVWVNCDDSYISVMSEKEVLKEGGRNGYMLIYKKRTVGDEMEFTHSKEYLKRN